MVPGPQGSARGLTPTGLYPRLSVSFRPQGVSDGDKQVLNPCLALSAQENENMGEEATVPATWMCLI